MAGNRIAEGFSFVEVDESSPDTLRVVGKIPGAVYASPEAKPVVKAGKVERILLFAEEHLKIRSSLLPTIQKLLGLHSIAAPANADRAKAVFEFCDGDPAVRMTFEGNLQVRASYYYGANLDIKMPKEVMVELLRKPKNAPKQNSHIHPTTSVLHRARIKLG